MRELLRYCEQAALAAAPPAPPPPSCQRTNPATRKIAKEEDQRQRSEMASHIFRSATLRAGLVVLFIDVDSVLRGGDHGPSAGVTRLRPTGGGGGGDGSNSFAWDPRCLEQLKRVTHHTGARLCLTSDWRNRAAARNALNRELVKCGLLPLIGRTAWRSFVEGGGRGGEIADWVRCPRNLSPAILTHPTGPKPIIPAHPVDTTKPSDSRL